MQKPHAGRPWNKVAACTVLVAAFALAGQAAAQDGVIDLHVHLHHGEKSLREFEAQAAADKVEVAALGAMWFGGPNQVLAGNVAATRAGNDRLIALAAANPKVLPIATVHPYDGEAALAELQRVAGRGVKILKIHPHTQKFDAADPRVLTLVKRAGELGITMVMDNASIVPGDCEKLFNLALAAPKTKFVFAHMGGFNFRFWNVLLALQTAKGLSASNMYFDISAIAVMVADAPFKDEFVWTIRNVGVDHVLLGSDYPQYSLAQNLAALDRLGLTDSEKAAIRSGNARKLFGLK